MPRLYQIHSGDTIAGLYFEGEMHHFEDCFGGIGGDENVMLDCTIDEDDTIRYRDFETEADIKAYLATPSVLFDNILSDN